MPENKICRSISFFDSYCRNEKTISLGPKRSIETNISKSSCFQDDKSIWLILLRIIECHKQKRTIYNYPQATLAITVEPIRAFLEPKRLLKTQGFDKSQLSSGKKNIWLFFSYYWVWQMPENKICRSTRFFDSYFTNDKTVSLGPNRSIGRNISKNRCFHDDKSFCPIFPRIIECDKHPGKNYKRSQATLTIPWKL